MLIFMAKYVTKHKTTISVVHKNFSRVGGFSKKSYEYFIDLSYRYRSVCFSELSENTRKTVFCQKFSCAAGNVFK